MEELKPRNITESERPFTDGQGRISRTTILQWFVGRHGPFIRQLSAEENTPEFKRKLITDKVQELRGLEQLEK